MKRFSAFFLAALMMISCLTFLSGCNNQNGQTPGGEKAPENPDQTGSDKMVIVSGGKSEYTVVRMEEYSDTVLRKLKEVVEAIKEVTGVELEYSDGFVKYAEDIDPDGKELVFGKCDSVQYAYYMQGSDYLSCVLRTV